MIILYGKNITNFFDIYELLNDLQTKLINYTKYFNNFTTF